MVDLDIFQIQENLVLLAYPSNFGREYKFKAETEKFLNAFKDFLLISVDDSKDFIKGYYKDHIVQKVNAFDISDKEVIKLVDQATHLLIFWDGTEHTKFIYQAIARNKPLKLIPIETTKVVNRNLEEDFDLYIGRKSPWGNPFIIDKDGNREEVIAKYRTHFYETILKDESKRKALLSLKGKKLGCHCKPLACHGDVIAEYLNSIED
ncbi:DUF4326 domain-containing protein [Methyloradius palustris]|uniref:DUF4326 domain-containing protein n=1 Tax=Methyloradius palustris TaxID=2778876 RepID=A0A8D5FYF4_9PROT|nr:DUF4326 domain-containing protein [Methyloradius palustris]BCM24347.1 hypothetical protein ZMTM_06060 [Methyloradius palustris]